MIDALVAFDIVLSLAILATATSVLAIRDRFTAIVAFVVFGLLSALAWVRLSAPDVALAEAAIGTGVTGALLLATLSRLDATRRVSATPAFGPVVANGAVCALVTLACLAAFLVTPIEGPSLGGAVMQAMPDSGVAHPVTAVLLNFRAFDTLMEVVVLLVAILAVWSIERGEAKTAIPTLGPIYAGFARLVLPAALVVGAYLLWVGAYAPGGAFQGGAVVAAVFVLILIAGGYRPLPEHRGFVRALFVVGVTTFVVVAVLVAQDGRSTLEYPLAHAKTLIMLVEALLTVSIAVTLAALFHGREPLPPARKEPTP